MRWKKYKVAALAEYRDSHEAHKGVLVTLLCYLEYQTGANELNYAEGAINLRIREAKVKHHAPEEADASKDAADGANVSKEHVVVNVHATEHFVRADESETVEE